MDARGVDDWSRTWRCLTHEQAEGIYKTHARDYNYLSQNLNFTSLPSSVFCHKYSTCTRCQFESDRSCRGGKAHRPSFHSKTRRTPRLCPYGQALRAAPCSSGCKWASVQSIEVCRFKEICHRLFGGGVCSVRTRVKDDRAFRVHAAQSG
jgi:hypothetical protein